MRLLCAGHPNTVRLQNVPLSRGGGLKLYVAIVQSPNGNMLAETSE